jgi:triacylglycerol lipase
MTRPRQRPPRASVAQQLTPALRFVRRRTAQWVRRLVGVALAAAATLATLAGPANAADTGPALQTSSTVLASALICPNAFHHPDKQVVLLGAGFGLWGTETYAKGLGVVLSNADFDWCTIDVPDRLLGDVQTNTEFTVAAVRWIHQHTGRTVSLVSHSIGAMEARWAVQWWPDVRATVDHVVTIEGANQGLPTANVFCTIPCSPTHSQARVGANFMTAMNSDPMPAGPVYTAIASITDVYNVSPTVYFIPGNERGNVYVQDKCPGRPVEHMQSVFDAAELGIVMDALTHPGQVDLTRVPNAVCGQLYAAGINPIDTTTSIASFYVKTPSGLLLGEKVTAEPPLRPYAQSARH